MQTQKYSIQQPLIESLLSCRSENYPSKRSERMQAQKYSTQQPLNVSQLGHFRKHIAAICKADQCFLCELNS